MRFASPLGSCATAHAYMWGLMDRALHYVATLVVVSSGMERNRITEEL